MQFAEITQRGFSDALPVIWDEQLRDLPADSLAAAGDALLKSWRSPYLPTPGDVRAPIDDAAKKGLALMAAAEWDKAVHFAKRVWHPDCGVPAGAARLDAVTWHALKAAGGLHYMNDCCGEELQWARKRFLEYFQTAQQTKKVEHLLTDGEAKRILSSIHGALPLVERKALTSAPAPVLVCEFPRRAPKPEIHAELTEEEWERRRAAEKEKIARYVSARPRDAA